MSEQVTEVALDEKALKAKLVEQGLTLGMQIHPNTSLDNMLNMVNMALIYKNHAAEEVTEKLVLGVDATNRAAVRKEAQKRIRVKVVNMDPTKKNHTAELFTFSNDSVGTIKQVVPLDSPVGFHIPQVLLEVIRERKYRITKYRKGRGIRGQEEDIPYSVELPSFSVEVLPPLSAAELDNIKQRQLAQAKID